MLSSFSRPVPCFWVSNEGKVCIPRRHGAPHQLYKATKHYVLLLVCTDLCLTVSISSVVDFLVDFCSTYQWRSSMWGKTQLEHTRTRTESNGNLCIHYNRFFAIICCLIKMAYQPLPVDHSAGSVGLLFSHLLTKTAPPSSQRSPCSRPRMTEGNV